MQYIFFERIIFDKRATTGTSTLNRVREEAMYPRPLTRPSFERLKFLKLFFSVVSILFSSAAFAVVTDFSTLELVFRDGMETLPADEGFGSIGTGCPRIIEIDGFQSRPAEAGGRFNFDSSYSPADLTLLTTGAQAIINNGGSGGSSLLAVAFAFEWLARCNGHALLKTADQIIYYDVAGKKIDFSAQLGAAKFGVTVTRGVNFPLDTPISVAAAKSLLEGKLANLSLAVTNVSVVDRWNRGVLVVLAPLEASGSNLVAALASIDAGKRGAHIVVIIVTDGQDLWLY